MELSNNRKTEEIRLMRLLKEFSREDVDEIAKILLKDPLLHDIGFSMFDELSEIQVSKLISAEKGESCTVYFQRPFGETLPFIITKETTVKQLKKEIAATISSQVETKSSLGNRKISWKFVWKNYCLMWKNVRLLEDEKRLSQYGIGEVSPFTSSPDNFITIVRQRTK